MHSCTQILLAPGNELDQLQRWTTGTAYAQMHNFHQKSCFLPTTFFLVSLERKLLLEQIGKC